MADSSERSPPSGGAPPPPPPSPPQSIDAFWARFMRVGTMLWLILTFGALGYLTGWQFDRQAGGWNGRIVSALVGMTAGAVLSMALRRGRGTGSQPPG